MEVLRSIKVSFSAPETITLLRSSFFLRYLILSLSFLNSQGCLIKYLRSLVVLQAFTFPSILLAAVRYTLYALSRCWETKKIDEVYAYIYSLAYYRTSTIMYRCFMFLIICNSHTMHQLNSTALKKIKPEH